MALWLCLLLPGVLAPVFEPRPALFPHSDKVMHFLGWFGMSGLAAWLERRRPFPVLATAWGVALGFLTELLQTDIPGRSGDVWDFLADVTGALVACLVAAALLRWHSSELGK